MNRFIKRKLAVDAWFLYFTAFSAFCAVPIIRGAL